MTNTILPHGQIQWIVDRMHVSVTDDEVESHIRSKMVASEWTEERKTAAVQYAIKCHKQNQELYIKVMGSI